MGGPFPPTPDNLVKAIVLGALVGAVVAVIVDYKLKKG